MEPFTLKSAPPYEAISYTWGKTPKSREIVVSARNLRVTPTMYDILQEKGRFWKSRNIWIDSICINQANELEKKVQVEILTEKF